MLRSVLCHNLADPLTKRIKAHANMDNVMSSKPVTFSEVNLCFFIFFLQNQFYWILSFFHKDL